MVLFNKVDPAPNYAKLASNDPAASKKSGAAGADSFASALKVSLAASAADGETGDEITGGETAAANAASEAAQGAAEDPNYVLAPDGQTRLPVHDWKTDTTDYAERMLSQETGEGFLEFAQWRVNQAKAQGIDISGNGAQPSNTELFNQWYPSHSQPKLQNFVYDRKEGSGYYGMDSDGHWGYYLDPELTQKNPDGCWAGYKASDGGRALFTTDRGYLWPANVRDESRANQTVTLVAGAKAFEVRYNEHGYIEAVVNLSAKGVNGNDLDLPMARSADDRGVNGQDLLRAASGVDYAGPGSGVEPQDVKGADHRDWDEVMTARGRAAVSAAQTPVEPEQTVVEPEQAPAAQTQESAVPAAQTPADEPEQTSAEAVQTPVDAARAPIGMAEDAPALSAEQVNEAIRLGNLTPQVLAAYEYLFGMPYEEEERT